MLVNRKAVSGMSVESLGEIHEITIIDRNRADNVGSVGRAEN